MSHSANGSFLLGLLVGTVSGAAVMKLLSPQKTSAVGSTSALAVSTSVTSNSNESNADASTSADFLYAGKHLLEFIVNYRTKLAPVLPVISRVQPNYLVEALPSCLPEEAEPWSNIFSGKG